MNAPLTLPSTKRCCDCHRWAPIGHFGDKVPDRHHLGRTVHIEHDTCQQCRSRSILPGRPFK